MTAIIGMCIKFYSCSLAIMYRQKDGDGNLQGGPMYYITKGIGPGARPLAVFFSIAGLVGFLGVFTVNQFTQTFMNVVNPDSTLIAMGAFNWKLTIGIVLSAITSLVIFGGLKKIARVATAIVPFMVLLYFGAVLVIMLNNPGGILPALKLIITEAFNLETAFTGGFWGLVILGVRRAVFSNEAGLGSAPIAHAATRTQDPVRQGIVAGLSPFIDTILVCTLTALLIIMTGAWQSGETGAELSQMAFNLGMPGLGDFVVGFGLIIFAFSTMLAWCYYGQVSFEYLFGLKGVTPYRLLYVVVIFIGAVVKLDFVWTFSDMMNGLMIVPNLIALLVLSPVIFRITKEYFDKN